MKEFFLQCLKDLEPLTGKRQLAFWETEAGTDLAEAQRKINVCIEGMVNISKQFNYIPEESQQKIIRRMMLEDQQYESLNARTIHKWLDLHKDKFPVNRISEDEMTPAIPFEETSQETKQLFAEALKRMEERKVPPVTYEQIKAEGIRKDPLLQMKAEYHPSTTQEDLEKHLKHQDYLRQNYHHITGEKLPTWMDEAEWLKQN